MKALNARQRQFVEEYLVDLNGRRAAMRAGYQAGTAAVVAWRLLRRPDVGALVAQGMAQRSDRTGVAQDLVLTQLAAIAGADLWDACDWGMREGRAFVAVREPATLGAETHRAVAEITLGAGGAVRVKMHDKMAALTALARHLGLFRDAPGAEAQADAGRGTVAALAEILARLTPTARAEMRAALAGVTVKEDGR